MLKLHPVDLMSVDRWYREDFSPSDFPTSYLIVSLDNLNSKKKENPLFTGGFSWSVNEELTEDLVSYVNTCF